MTSGILASLSDPVFMAKLAERQRIAERVAEQMGCSVREAREALDHFEIDLCSCGQTLH